MVLRRIYLKLMPCNNSPWMGWALYLLGCLGVYSGVYTKEYLPCCVYIMKICPCIVFGRFPWIGPGPAICALPQ